VVDAVYDYGVTRRLLGEALDDAVGRLPAEEFERLRRDAGVAAIRDWAELKALTTGLSGYEEAVFDAET
jgi:hypothetical protein